MIGTTTASGTAGQEFVTYDTTLASLRPLNSNEYDTVSAAYATVGNNVYSTGSATTVNLTPGARVFNSFNIIGNTFVLNGAGGASDTLTLSSGAVNFRATTTAGATISDFSSVIFGNGEALITAGGQPLSITSALDVTSSGGLTEAGTGNLIVAATSLYLGQTTINQGSVQFGIGGNVGGLAAGNTSNIALVGGNVTFTRSGDYTIGNAITGTGSFTKTGWAT